MKILAFIFRWFGFLIGLGGLGLAGAALASPLGWPFELFASWPYLITSLGLGSAIVLGVTGWHRFATGLVAGALIVAALAIASPGDLTRPSSGPASPGITTLVWGNSFGSAANVEALRELGVDAGATIIAIGEAPRETRTPSLDKITSGEVTRKGAILVQGCEDKNQAFVNNVRYGQIVRPRTFAIKVTCSTFTLFAVHLTNPLWQLGERHKRRGEELVALAKAVKEVTGPVVVIGDFNTAPNAPPFSRFMQAANLAHSACGGRWLPTWRPENWRGKINDRSPLTGIPIDHLFTRDIVVESCSVGGDFGSDHLPLIARLKLPTSIAPAQITP